MWWLTKKRVERRIDTKRILAAIRAAEQQTSGEICVSISPWFWGSIELAAKRAFRRLGMASTRQRNGVLFFVVPSRRSLFVLGDVGIDAHVGSAGWQQIVATAAASFSRTDLTSGLLVGIASIAEALAWHWPFDPLLDENELPDAVDVGDSTS